MNTVKFENKDRIKMIAHRGLSGLERENTCPAFVAAGQRDYFGIETDVHITRDGKFILCHDSNVERVAGVSMIIEETDFDELRKIRFTDIDGTPRADVFLPTLEEYLHICRKYGKVAVIEIKGAWEDGYISRLADGIKQAKMLESTVFISFAKESCLGVAKIVPDAKIQFLSGVMPEESVSFCIENGFDADFQHNIITKELVNTLHKAGRLVNCWTVNSVEKAEEMKACGVDFITTNILE